ncbi:MAG: hypothetical protein KC503_26160 [Myxococcales bacterium]|nr:hypothetical protein [Myxococcales bacterium]
MRLLALAGVLAIGAAACSDNTKPFEAGVADGGDGGVNEGGGGDAGYPNLPGGNPLVPEVAMYPFPSDFYLAADSKTKTGYHIEVPAEALPKGTTPAMFSQFDGYTLIPAILAYFGQAGIDIKSLPDPTKPELTVAADSPVYLLEVKSDGTVIEKVPVLAELDQRSPVDTHRALILRPHRALTPNTKYVVVIRDKVKHLDGSAITPRAAFVALRDGTPTSEPAIESQRDAFKIVNAAIKNAGLKPEEVILAWSFHSRSEEQVTAPLLAMHDVMNSYTMPDPVITSDTVDSNNNRQLVGELEVPSFLPGNKKPIELGSDGKPKQFGTKKIEFLVTIPESVTTGGTPRPTIVYGHGFLGGPNQGTRGNTNEIMRTYKYPLVATYIGVSEDLFQPLLDSLTSNLPGIDYFVSEVMQKIANQTAMVRLVREKLATGANGFKYKDAFDGSKVHYFGISNGGTFGMLTTATSPQFERGVLSVGGGGLTHFLQRAVQWNEYGPIVDKIYKNPLDQQLLFSLIQTNLDPVDCMSYVHRLVNNRFPGRKPFTALFIEAVNDSQVRNLLTEWAARTAKLKLVTPSAKDLYGFETISAPSPGGAPAGTSALMVFDEKLTPSPVTNIPPKEDNGTHGSVHKIPAMRNAFFELIENGRVVQNCTGACDPE